MPNTKKLNRKIVVVTGAGRGVGRTTAELFAREGASLILIARTASELAETAANCRSFGADVRDLIIDLSRPGEFDSLQGALASGVDILVNNAAILIKGAMVDYNATDFDQMLAVNLRAPFLLAQMCIPIMKRRGGGTIVNISSLSGCIGVPKFAGFGPYNITKYGLWGLTEILALEHFADGIRVNQLSLAAVDTRMLRTAAPDLKPNLTVDQVARQVLYLAANDSEPLTGENIILNGMPSRR